MSLVSFTVGAKPTMRLRTASAETNISPDFPTSQEYLATDAAHPFFGYHRVFAWNSFVLQALEMAGMRKPELDPDAKPK